MKSNKLKTAYLQPQVDETFVMEKELICTSLGDIIMPNPWDGNTEQEW